MWNSPPAWARSHMKGWNPAWYQDDILDRLARDRKVSVVGPHGIGKTSTDSIAVHWFADTRERAGIDWKVVTTAGAWRQLQRYLWPEIQKWSKRRIQLLRKDELLTQEIKLHYGQAFAVASDDPANIEGAHADEILYIIDEAKNVPPGSWDAIEGALSAGNAYVLANSTPGKAEGRLFEIHDKHPGYEDWVTIHVTLEQAIEAGRIKREWAQARARQWGVTSSIYLNRVLGEFSTTDSDGVIPLEWLDAANERWKDLEAASKLKSNLLTAVAADVASEEGSDKTVIAERYGDVLSRIEVYPDITTLDTARKVKAILDYSPNKGSRRPPIAVIDAIGVGTGAVEHLREQGVSVDAFMGSQKALHQDKTGELTFLNRRAEAWWHLRDLLNPAFGEEIAIPPIPELQGDLLAPKYDQTASGAIKIEDKDDIRVRLGRSPDQGDAVTMAFNARVDRSVDPLDAVPIGIAQASRWSSAPGSARSTSRSVGTGARR